MNKELLLFLFDYLVVISLDLCCRFLELAGTNSFPLLLLFSLAALPPPPLPIPALGLLLLHLHPSPANALLRRRYHRKGSPWMPLFRDSRLTSSASRHSQQTDKCWTAEDVSTF